MRQGLVGVFATCLALGLGPVEQEPTRGVLTGTVVDEAGKPVAAVEISATTLTTPETAKSLADGTFRLSLPLLSSGRIMTMIVVRGENNRLGVLFVAQDPERVTPLTVVLKPSRALEVRVVDRGGQPVEGATIHFPFHGLFPYATGKTDAEGRWKVNVPADSDGWGVYAFKSRTGLDYAQAERARGSAEPPHSLPEQLTLTLDGARAPLRVRAVDRDGKPLPGVEVGPWLIQRPDRESLLNNVAETFVKTDEAGVATFDWLPERASLSITSRMSSDYYRADTATAIPLDKPVNELTLTFLPYERLSGRVTTADGRPAAGATVSLQGQGAGNQRFRNMVRTDADGRYGLKVYAEQAYILTATKDETAAPYKAGVVVRAGKPVEGVDLVLGPGTRVRGQVTLGIDHRPVAKVGMQVYIDGASIPDELKKAGDRVFRSMSMSFSTWTDNEGRYAFLLGPGDYRLQGPPRVEPVKFTIPAGNPPSEIARDFTLPMLESDSFTATVVDLAGKPVPGALLHGPYRTMSNWFSQTVADAQGTSKLRRAVDPVVVLMAETPDHSLAAIAHVDAATKEVRLVVKPMATATGRLVDQDGKALAGRTLEYGIRIRSGWRFGGTTTTDAAGAFRLLRLVVGESYAIQTSDDQGDRTIPAGTKAKPTEPGTLVLGDVMVDLSPLKPYVPRTPPELTGLSFAARKEKTTAETLAFTLTEAKRELTRPLLLFGGPQDPVCVELFRLFNEYPEIGDLAEGKPRPKTPAVLRWEFELASLDTSQADVAAFAKGLGVAPGDGKTPVLAVFSEDGKLTATYPLTPGADGRLDARALAAFLARYTPPTRDADRLLAEALARAKAEEKRVFLIISASWCGPCRLLGRYLVAQKTELERHYVFVKLDVSRNTHARAIAERYEGKGAPNGIPWYVILDAAGMPLITSNAKELAEESSMTNIGFPGSKIGIDHFLKMLKQTAPALSEEALARLRQDLTRKP